MAIGGPSSPLSVTATLLSHQALTPSLNTSTHSAASFPSPRTANSCQKSIYMVSNLRQMFRTKKLGNPADDLVKSTAQGWDPSPVVKINGTDVVSWLSQKAFNETMTHQDLDTLSAPLPWLAQV